MGRSATLITLVGRCQKRSDMENQASISTADWKEMISTLYAELYGELCKPGVGYFDTIDTIITDGGASYALPSDHLSTIGIDEIIDDAGHRRPLIELMVQERHLFAGVNGPAKGFRFDGTNILLYPTPQASKTYEHIYIPQPTDLSSAGDSTVVEMATSDGEAFLIWGVTAMALHRLEMDPRFASQQQEAARERVIEWATLRAINSTRRRIVTDDEMDIDFYDPASYRWTPA